MGYYIRSRAADWLLCLCLTAGLTAALCAGFVLEDSLSGHAAAVFVLAALLQALLLLIAYSRLTTVIGISAGVVLAAAAVFYMQANNLLTDETANSTFLFLLIETVTAVLVFLLSRTRPGMVVLFLLGTLIQAGSHFLAFPAPLWGFLLFSFAALVLFFYRTYTVSLLEAELGTVRTGRYLRQTVLVCLVALAVGGGLYFGVVRPLNPPTQELKLIRVLRSMPILEVLGVSSTEIILDTDLASQEPPDETELGGEQGEEDSTGLEGQQPETPPEPSDTQTEHSDATQKVTAVRYDGEARQLLWFLLLIPLLIAAVFVLRVILRRRWHRRVQTLPHAEAVLTYYPFFLSRLEKIGLKRMPSHTLREYVSHQEVQLQAFDAEDSTFGALTAVYEKTLYGGCAVTEGEYQAFEQFYAQFYHNLRREAGTVKYCLQIFRF